MKNTLGLPPYFEKDKTKCFFRTKGKRSRIDYHPGNQSFSHVQVPSAYTTTPFNTVNLLFFFYTPTFLFINLQHIMKINA